MKIGTDEEVQGPYWKKEFMRQIRWRNRYHCDSFAPLINAYSNCLFDIRKYRGNFAEAAAWELNSCTTSDTPHCCNDAKSSVNLQKAIARMQTEIHSLCAYRVELMEECLLLKEKLAECQELLEAKNEALAAFEVEMDVKTNYINELETQVRLLASERIELQSQVDKFQKDLIDKTLEADRILEELLRYKESEAGRLNELQSIANNLYSRELQERQNRQLPTSSSQPASSYPQQPIDFADRYDSPTNSSKDPVPVVFNSFRRVSQNTPSPRVSIGSSITSASSAMACELPSSDGMITQKTHEGSVFDICISWSEHCPKAALLASGGQDGYIALLNPNTAQLHYSFPPAPCKSAVLALDIAGDQIGCLAACADQCLYAADLKEAASQSSMRGHCGRITSCGYRNPTSTHKAFSTSLDRSIRVWDVERACCIKAASTPSAVTSGERSPDFEHLVTGHYDGSLNIWSLRSESCAHVNSVNKFHDDIITGFSFSNDGNYVAAQSKDSVVKIFDFRRGTTVRTLSAPGFRTSYCQSAPSFSPDGHATYVAAISSTFIAVWEAKSGHLVASYSTVVPAVRILWVLEHLVSAHKDGTVRCWGLSSKTGVKDFLSPP